MKDTTLSILDHEISLKNEDTQDWVPDMMGVTNVLASKILIRSDLPTDVKRSTTIHEVIHWIANMNSIELDEQDVDGLAMGINSLITNNLDWINETWKSK